MIDTTDLQASFVGDRRSETTGQPLRRRSNEERWKHGLQRVRTLLCLSASPIFGLLAVINASLPGMDICSSLGGMSFLGGMTTMYGVMCIIHLEAWLKRLTPSGK
jgi:hypothetical protein